MPEDEAGNRERTTAQPTEAPGRPDGPNQTGESGGGPYPNPHDGGDEGDFKGGQSDHSYSGPENENATSEEE